ncbi:MAG: YitT family protein [Bacteroidales bacterium]|nr:YitT family protein [Bacteroidales bacterium]MCR5243531.1 YitT family protein [Bacteroidales bacterium]MDT3357636.1 YitT family protein [Bacteroidota bacterium]
MLSEKSILISFKEYFLITVGILCYVTGWSLFLIPNNLVGGGVSGVSSIIQYATGFKMGYTYFIVNAGLLLIAFFILGAGFGGKTIYAIILASLGLSVLPDIIPFQIVDTLALQNGKLMSVIMGGIMAGVGIGMSMTQGGSTGGTDIIALIVNKYRNFSPGRLILWMDVFIILSSIVVPSYTADGSLVSWPDKVTTVVYGLILVTVNGYVVDLYISGSRQSVQLFILSQKYDKIADCITGELHRGVTVLPATGWYTQKASHVLMVITRKADLNVILRHIKLIDPDAFLSVGSATGVYGKGFDTIKTGKK